MPPKATPKKKDDKTSDRTSKPQPVPLAVPLNETSREFYLVQIRDLEQRLERYQKRCDELEISNSNFHDKYVQMDSDKREIIAYWKQQLKLKGDELSDLSENYNGLQLTKQIEKEQFEKQVSSLQNELDRVKEELTAENTILNGKLAVLEEFRIQRKELLEKFAKMEVELREMEEQNKQTIYQLEKKQVIDKDRLKKDMFMRVNQLVAEFRKVSNKQMAETTKRTIRENVSLTAQMSKMSDKTMELIQENDELKNKVKRMKNKIDVLEYNEKEITKKMLNCQKHITLLTTKCQENEGTIAEMQQKEIEFKKKLKETENLQQQLENTEETIRTVLQNSKELTEKLHDTETKFDDIREENSMILQILQDASAAIKDYLLSLEADDNTSESHELIGTHRDNMMQHLLMILNTARVLGLGPGIADLNRSRSLQTDTIKPQEKKKIINLPPIQLKGRDIPPAHYNLGDIGFVPRSSQPGNVESDSSSEEQQTELKENYQSTGVQTLSMKRTLFFNDEILWQAFPSTKFIENEVTKKPESTGSSFSLRPRDFLKSRKLI
ncbi:cilia- and flagella-associated protein 157 [Octopus bimaculoides]|uniref:Cilia- and flagella-associated protein 157 n=1 Tax=Octopus bimaculoides TaxID=37653 RepID=A0A0L8GQP2_OCTBM|nr:cilia- and flagella-associated protein 157 [Octopus bimaculoides]|eukprot:XP_014778852.1 PREDICTED: uncharacterized protein C9orf117 homolog [Octopus bimaculoides]